MILQYSESLIISLLWFCKLGNCFSLRWCKGDGNKIAGKTSGDFASQWQIQVRNQAIVCVLPGIGPMKSLWLSDRDFDYEDLIRRIIWRSFEEYHPTFRKLFLGRLLWNVGLLETIWIIYYLYAIYLIFQSPNLLLVIKPDLIILPYLITSGDGSSSIL